MEQIISRDLMILKLLQAFTKYNRLLTVYKVNKKEGNEISSSEIADYLYFL